MHKVYLQSNAVAMHNVIRVTVDSSCLTPMRTCSKCLASRTNVEQILRQPLGLRKPGRAPRC